MAKTADELAQELADSIEATDSTIDTVQGPIPNVFIRPQSGLLADSAAEAEQLRQLFTINFGAAATDEEIALALGNFGSAPGAGTKARHTQFFMRFTRPTVDITIPAGTLVSTIDGSLVYQVVNGGSMYSSNPNIYYNADKNSYELGLTVEAIGTGADYDLPKYRINTILTPIQGIDTTENRTKSAGGEEAETRDNQIARLKDSLKGINLGAPGGISSQILNDFSSTVTDVQVIQPFESVFKRIATGPALDVYIIGYTTASVTETYIAVVGQTEIYLNNKPAVSVTNVTINGIASPIGYALEQDQTPESGYSLNALDKVVFDSPLGAGDEVTIEYTYNSALSDVNNTTFESGDSYLFNTDILVRYPFVVNPVISGEIKVLASYTISEVEESLLSYLSTRFNFTVFTEIIYPEIIRQEILTNVSGIQSMKVTEFHRSFGSYSDIEPLIFQKNEISQLDTTQINFTFTGK